MTDVVIAADQLCFAYKDKQVLHNIQLSVLAGEIYGLVGADGAGKSTLLSLGVGQLAASSGSIKVLGEVATKPLLRDDIAYMPQGFGLYPDLSVQENLDFFADLHGLSATKSKPRIKDLLQRTGLVGFEDRRGGNLSGGMMQKLALACALVHEPKVMFLDEPTTGVDPLSRRAFWRLIEGVKADGVAILYATANMDEAERCDRVGMLKSGQLTRQGTPLDLMQQDTAVMVAVLGANVRRHRREIKALPGVQLAFPIGLRLNVWLDRGESLPLFRHGIANISGDLTVEQSRLSLHDTALRDLAMEERAQEQEHARG